MSILETIAKPDNRPIVATICADAGIGKTSLAACFPKPIFIRAEDGLQAIPEANRPDAFPVIKSVTDLWQQIKGLIDEEHDYKTLVIDSITQLEQMFGQYVIDCDPKKPKSLAQANGGYGAGFGAVAALHQRVRAGVEILNRDRGMHIVFIAHADTETIELPDSDPYTRYNLRLNKKSMPPYADNVDLVGFMKLQVFTHGDGDRKKAISDGTRIMVAYPVASNISKNRFGITEDLIVEEGKNPLAGIVPGL